MKFCTVVFVALLGSVVGEKAGGKKVVGEKRRPIITAAIFHDTIELVADVADNLYTSVLEPHVTKHSPKVIAAVDEHMAKAGIKKSEITAKYDTLMGHVSTAKANLAVHKTTAQARLDEVAAKVVSKFDQAMPKYAGAVPDTFSDLLVFSLYSLFVLYVVFTITRKVFGISMGLFCFFFCCGCCRGGKTGKAAASGGKKGAAKDAKKADSNGKAQQKKK